MTGETASQILYQTADSKHLPNRYRMYPDDCLAGGLQPFRNTPEPFLQSGAILAMTRHLEEPIGKAHQHCERQQRAVEPIHGRDILTAGIYARFRRCTVTLVPSFPASYNQAM